MLRWIALTMGLLLPATAPCADPPKPSARAFRLQWRDLERLTKGRRIAIELPSGIKLQGDVTAVEPDELVLNVTKTSNRRAYPKGRAIVPRPEVTRLRILRTRHTWRIAGTATGATIGAATAIPMAIYAHNEGGRWGLALAIVVAAPTAIGYLLGWAADNDVVQVIVEPSR
jgi:hypothetical protein